MGKPKNNMPLGREARTTFLLRLAESCDVEAAARAIGVHPTRAYATRRHHPAFAAAWAEAMRQGVDRLETALLARAVAAVATEGAASLSPDQLLRLASYWRARAEEMLADVTDNDVDDGLADLLEGLRRRRQRIAAPHDAV